VEACLRVALADKEANLAHGGDGGVRQHDRAGRGDEAALKLARLQLRDAQAHPIALHTPGANGPLVSSMRPLHRFAGQTTQLLTCLARCTGWRNIWSDLTLR